MELKNLLNIFRKKEKRSYEEPITDFGDALLFGHRPNNYASMNLSAVFRCVDLISDSISILPLKVINPNSKHISENNNHPLNLVFSDGIYNMNRIEFMKLLIQSVVLKGNGFAHIERTSDGTVKALRFLDSGDVQIHYDKMNKNSLFYTCNVMTKNKIEPCNMIHLRKYSYDGVNGKSVLSFAERTLKLSQSSENSALGLFENGCNLSGVLKVQGQLTKEQRHTIHTTWNQSMSRGGNGLAVLQGNMDYQAIQMSASDSQLLESRLFQVDEIARFFGINPVLIGDLTHNSYNSLELAQQEFLLHTLQPYIIMVEEEFTNKLFKPSENNLRIELDETAIIKTDKQALANYYNSLLNSGVLCINEVRKELGFSEIKGGDKHIIPFTDINQNTINNANNGEQTVS